MAKFIAGLVVAIILIICGGPWVWVIAGGLFVLVGPTALVLIFMHCRIKDLKEKQEEEERNNPNLKKIYIIK